MFRILLVHKFYLSMIFLFIVEPNIFNCRLLEKNRNEHNCDDKIIIIVK